MGIAVAYYFRLPNIASPATQIHKQTTAKLLAKSAICRYGDVVSGSLKTGTRQ
ncbi:hypothetical protein [Kingella sp. (in: b-proteobacteria)]|uniref:hypothetical protein n=1 Tax=Kingella sp. (in: b-proteobacteria) TaxID=2020713 RepID=UPI0026DC9076|nr:hypothetical protein [Kingella sp. (in: b-proteobacteria)]MDO4658688.1 hypothetical protein [Kingella sp. (in: b-proteobacteria)]